ncbi:MAG TPA: cysteine synthase A [Flavihumibacter sp.]|nr:cysteine synthase A [Flavihumibacter sp.]
MSKIYTSADQLIGKTPMLRLTNLEKKLGLNARIIAKLEYYNPAGSVKDRIAKSMIDDAEASGKLKPGAVIIEPTSGNTGIGLAAVAAARGYKLMIVMPETMSVERRQLMKAYGAEIVLSDGAKGMRGAIAKAEELAAEIPGSFIPGQFDNPANPKVHRETTGPEIWEQTDGKITHLVCTAGTGGTVTGTAQYLKEKNPHIQVWAIDVFGSLLTKYFRTGEIDMNEVHPYISEGFGEDFVPENYDMSVIDHFEQVTDKDGAVMARKLAREEGLFCGYSAGSCLQGLMQLGHRLKTDDVVVCILHDHGSRYVAKVYNDQWMMERGFLDVKTFKDIVIARGPVKKLISLTPNQTVAEAVELMRKYDIEQIPVFDNKVLIGSISEGGLFQKIFEDGDTKNAAVSTVMEAPFPVVDFFTPVEKLSTLIHRENGAVISRDEAGNYQILTKYDVLQALGK